jgi:hypothetical protein
VAAPFCREVLVRARGPAHALQAARGPVFGPGQPRARRREIAERSQIINEIKVRGGAVKASRVTAHPSYADACHQSIDVTGIAIGR